MEALMKNKLLTVLFGIVAALLIISFSIGIPIWFRPFYYWQIEVLDIPGYSGEDTETIKEAYDEVLDYLTLPGREFGTGELKYSEEGKSHFEDCKVLFALDFWVFVASLAAFVTLAVLAKLGKFKLCRPFDFHVLMTSGVSILAFFAIIALFVAIDFDSAFKVFHTVFFPGKDNWYFGWDTDQIIRILPSQFFLNCGILIFSSILLLCIGCVVYSIILKMRPEPMPEEEKPLVIDFSKDGFDIDSAKKKKSKKK